MRSACASVVGGLLLLSCSPQGSSRPPEPSPSVAATEPAPSAPAPDGVGSAPASPGTPDAAEPAPEAEAGVEPAGSGTPTESAAGPATTGPATEPATEPATGSAAEPTPTEPTPASAAKVATLELPRALHTTVDDQCGKDPGVGERLKSFSLPGLEAGKTVTNSTFRGRVQVVNFWGTWCKPCLKELPEFDQLYRRYRKHGMTLLAIATDEDAETVKQTVSKKKLGAKIAIAGEDYAGQYGSPKFPFTFVVDYKGVIRGSYRGYRPECMGKLEADIREQLQVRAEAKARRRKKK